MVFSTPDHYIFPFSQLPMMGMLNIIHPQLALIKKTDKNAFKIEA
jgi:hypothetical protein